MSQKNSHFFRYMSLNFTYILKIITFIVLSTKTRFFHISAIATNWVRGWGQIVHITCKQIQHFASASKCFLMLCIFHQGIPGVLPEKMTHYKQPVFKGYQYTPLWCNWVYFCIYHWKHRIYHSRFIASDLEITDRLV